MYLNYRGIARFMALFLVIIAVSMIPAAAVSLVYGELSAARSFLLTIVPLSTIGILFFKAIKKSPYRFQIRDGFLIVSLCWISASLISAIPFVLSGSASFVDAFFEASSGISTTGSTVFRDVESLPRGLLFWRSATNWIGGLGVLLTASTLFPALGFDSKSATTSELTGMSINKASPHLSNSASATCLIYSLLTVSELAMLKLSGLSFFDSIIHSLSTVGTGGFSNYNDGISHFANAHAECIIMVFMFISGISYNLYHMALIRNPSEILRDSEFRLYSLAILASASVITLYMIAVKSPGGALAAAHDALFQCASVVSTTGYTTADIGLLQQFPKAILFSLMFIGACSASPGSGIKVIRLHVLFKLIKRGILVRLHPNAITKIKLRDRTLTIDAVQSIAGFFFLYFFMFLVTALFVALDGFDPEAAVTISASSLGNIGISFGELGQITDYSAFSPAIKLLLSFVMIAGRLEIYTFLMLFSARFWNPNR